MRTLTIALMTAAMAGLSGCVFIADGQCGECWPRPKGSKGLESTSPELVELRQQNQSIIASRLNIGMSESEVRAAFGDRTARGVAEKDARELYVPNPYKTETVYCDEGTAKVLWYYSRINCDNGLVADDELTPVLFVNGRIVGWGNRFYGQYCRKVPAPQPPKPPMN